MIKKPLNIFMKSVLDGKKRTENSVGVIAVKTRDIEILETNELSMKSRFAQALEEVFNNTNNYTLKDWAHFLIVSESTIQNWLDDKELPEPFHIKLILNIIKVSHTDNLIQEKKFIRVLSGLAKFMTPLYKEIDEASLLMYAVRK